MKEQADNLRKRMRARVCNSIYDVGSTD